MAKHADRYDAYDVKRGKYSHRQIPKWDYNQSEFLEYLKMMDMDPPLAGPHLPLLPRPMES